MGKPQSTSISGMFGVMTVPSGRSFVISDSMASSEISLYPLVETMTGSTMMFLASYCLSL
jgi:hypothetical protein